MCLCVFACVCVRSAIKRAFTVCAACTPLAAGEKYVKMGGFAQCVSTYEDVFLYICVCKYTHTCMKEGNYICEYIYLHYVCTYICAHMCLYSVRLQFWNVDGASKCEWLNVWAIYLYMYVHIYIYVNIHIYIQMYILIYQCMGGVRAISWNVQVWNDANPHSFLSNSSNRNTSRAHICLYINVHICTHRHTCVYLYVDMYIYVHMYLHTYINIHMYTCIHICINLYIYIYSDM